MAAVFVINQPTGGGAGIPGVARRDLWLNQSIVLLCASAESTYSWDVLDKPTGSAVPSSLGNGAGFQTTSFTPDVWGTYRIRLTTNNGAGGASILLLRIKKDSVGTVIFRGWAKFAFDEQPSEANYDGNARGYADDWDFIIDDILASLTGLLLAGDVTGLANANSVDAIHEVRTPPIGSEFAGATFTVADTPVWTSPIACAWDTASSVLWVADGNNPSLYRYTPSTGKVKKYSFPGLGLSSFTYMRLDASYIYLGADASFGPPGSPSVLIINRATGVLVGRMAVSSALCRALSTDGAGNLFAMPGFGADLEKYSIAQVLSAFPANGALVATVAGTTNTFPTSDVCSDGTFIYATTDTGGGQIFQIDPVLAVIVQTLGAVPAGTGYGLTTGGGWLWAAFGAGSVARINTTTMTVDTTVITPFAASRSITYDPLQDKVWVGRNLGPPGQIFIIDGLVPGNPVVTATTTHNGDYLLDCPRNLSPQPGFLSHVWSVGISGFPDPPGHPTARRFSGVFFSEEIRFQGPLSLKYVTPTVPNVYNVLYLVTQPPVPITTLSASSTVMVFADTVAAPGPGPITVDLPAVPSDGDSITVKDSAGGAAVNNITVNGNGPLIDGAASYVIAIPYESLSLVFNLAAGNWSVV